MPTSEKKINWKTNLFFIWLSQILSIIGFASAVPFIPIYIRDKWGITGEQELGVWMSAFYFFGMLSFCVFIPFWGILADRYGRKLMLLRACYVDAILFPCFLLAPNPVWLIVVRFITSAFTGTISAAQTLVVTTTPEEHHGFALGALATAIWSGNLFGFAAGGLIVHYFGFTCAFLCCGAMYLTAGLLAHFFVQENFQPPVHTQKESLGHSWSGLSITIWLSFFLILLTAVARRFDDPYIALMIERIHGPENTAFHTGWINALAAFGGILSGLMLGRLCDRYSPKYVTVPALLIAGITMAMEGAAATLAGYGTIRFVNYLASGGLEAAFLAILSKISPTERRGAIFGLASGLRMAGILISTILSGAIIYLVGVRNIYFVAGALFLAAIPFFWLTVRTMNHAAPADKPSPLPSSDHLTT